MMGSYAMMLTSGYESLGEIAGATWCNNGDIAEYFKAKSRCDAGNGDFGPMIELLVNNDCLETADRELIESDLPGLLGEDGNLTAPGEIWIAGFQSGFERVPASSPDNLPSPGKIIASMVSASAKLDAGYFVLGAAIGKAWNTGGRVKELNGILRGSTMDPRYLRDALRTMFEDDDFVELAASSVRLISDYEVPGTFTHDNVPTHHGALWLAGCVAGAGQQTLIASA